MPRIKHPVLAESGRDDIISQWDWELNEITPSDVTLGSGIGVHWLCPNNHRTYVSVSQRALFGKQCIHCSGRGGVGRVDRSVTIAPERSLSSVYPEVAKWWHPELNQFGPDTVAYTSSERAWWTCPREHSESTEIRRRVQRKRLCLECAGSLYGKRRPISEDFNLSVIHPEVSKLWHPILNDDLTPDSIHPGANMDAWWLCPNGHTTRAQVIRRVQGVKCGSCAPRQHSFPENELRSELARYFYVDPDHDSIVDGKGYRMRCDIYLPKDRVIIEYDGCYWHRESDAEDALKTSRLESLGWLVIRVRESPLGKITNNDIIIEQYDIDSAIRWIKSVLDEKRDSSE